MGAGKRRRFLYHQRFCGWIPSTGMYGEVRVELELVYLLADWGVHINIVSKKADDAVGGTDATGLHDRAL